MDVGGTWFENKYPGAACDLPSSIYHYSFEPKYDWSSTFSGSDEIHDYIKFCASKYEILSHIKFNTVVEEASYSLGKWYVKVNTQEDNNNHNNNNNNKETLVAEILVSGMGQLNVPKIPGHVGSEKFCGISFHTSRWNQQYDLSGKNVAIIGNGPSGIQVIPQIASKVQKLYIFQRTPNYIVPTFISQTKLPSWLLRAGVGHLHRWLTYLFFEHKFGIFIQKNEANEKAQNQVIQFMKSLLPVHLHQKLLPTYRLGCKRILASEQFFEVLSRPNVQVITQPIESLGPHSIFVKKAKQEEQSPPSPSSDDDQQQTEFNVDCIIYATGFYTNQFLSSVKIIGSSQTLEEAWQTTYPKAYLGLVIPGFPNFFMLYGPNTNLGHNSIVFMIECQVNYILQAISQMSIHSIQQLDLKKEVLENYQTEVEKRMETTTWTGCNSWYRNKEGKVVNNLPFSTIEYWWRTLTFSLDVYNTEYFSSKT